MIHCAYFITINVHTISAFNLILGIYIAGCRMKSSLKREPKYGVCAAAMRRQFDESLRIQTMSMDLSLSCSSADDPPTRLGAAKGSEVGRDADAESNLLHQAGYDYNAGHTYDEDDNCRGFSWGYFNADGASCMYRSGAAIGHEQGGDVSLADEPARDPGHWRSEPELGDGIANAAEPEWNASEEWGPAAAEDGHSKSGRRRRSRSRRRSRNGDHGSGRDAGRRLSGERGRGRRAAASRVSKDFPVPFVVGHDEEMSALSFMGEQVLSADRSVGSQEQTNPCPSPREERLHSPIADRGLKINPNEPDASGRCVRHPQVRLRKKTFFGGWKILISACPNCCLQELQRMSLQLAGQHAVRRQGATARPALRKGFREAVTAERVGAKASVDHTVSLTTSSWGSQQQDSAEQERSATKDKKRHKKSKEKTKRSKSRDGGHRHSARPRPLSPPSHGDPGTRASETLYVDKDDRSGVYAKDRGVTAYADDGPVPEGKREEWRRQPRATSEGGGNGGGSHLKLRSALREDRLARGRRRRPTRVKEFLH